MKKIAHCLLYGLISLLSWLPFRALYMLADAAYFVMYRVAGYRKKIVRKNLRNSFPDLDKTDLKAIEKEFYRNFADYIFETIKYKSVSYEKLRRRMTFENVGLIERHFAEGRSVVAYFSHCGNWEWVTLMGEQFRGQPDKQLAEIYRPLKDKWMDALMLRIRTRFNTLCIPKKTALRELLTLRRDGILTCTGFMSDQKPSHGDQLHVVEFLHQPTAVITGTETLARKMGMAVVYFDITRLSRGHYHLRVVPMADDASLTPEFALTNQYFSLLQANILRQPSLWLWTHNRWKHPVPTQAIKQKSVES